MAKAKPSELEIASILDQGPMAGVETQGELFEPAGASEGVRERT